ncbi:hypothetical protein VMCG_01930 [Cytospora schulzeri]|uniref:RNase H type-1 domain-containing protein n=1 Tax=Cytospora schulzeri TaxID=448051 RepID=A0A423X3T7_9PEZI|nr:hypothetical protein VMCG_01930 [Valsa malicola]
MQITIQDTPSALSYASSIYNDQGSTDKKNTNRNIVFWTDASVDLRTQSNPGGGAVTLQDTNNTTADEKDTWTEYSFGVRGHHSIHQVELVAIHQALTLARNSIEGGGPKGIYVLTDSQTALEWIRRTKGETLCASPQGDPGTLSEEMERHTAAGGTISLGSRASTC